MEKTWGINHLNHLSKLKPFLPKDALKNTNNDPSFIRAKLC